MAIDVLGRPIGPGDRVACALRWGNHPEMRTGEVVTVGAHDVTVLWKTSSWDMLPEKPTKVMQKHMILLEAW